MLLDINSNKSNHDSYLNILVLVLTLFSGLSTYLYFLIDHSLVGDAFSYFPFFQEHLFSLNRYGGIAWWFPHVQNGWATDFVSILSYPGISPLFALLASIIWMLGRLGFFIDQFFYIYIFYYGFFLTGLFLYSILLLSKEIFKSKLTKVYLLSVASFSPAIITQSTEMTKIEPLIFFILLIVSVIKLYKEQSRIKYYFFTLSIYGFILSINLVATFFTIPAIIIIIISSFIFIPGLLNRTTLLINKVRLINKILFFMGLFVCLSPLILTALNVHNFSFNTDSVSATGSPDGLKYDIRQMVPGNPLEFLFGSTPGIGLNWIGYRNTLQILASERSAIAYIYCGFTSLPFFIFGYLYSKKVLKHYILFCLILLGSVLVLCNYSPIMGIIYSFESPILSINHFNDNLFVTGGFIIIIFGSALGLDTWLESTKNKKAILTIIFSWAFLSLLTFSTVIFFSPSFLPYGGRVIFSSKILGLYIFSNFIMILILKSWIQNINDHTMFKFLFILVIIIDISTQSFIHISKRLHHDLPMIKIVEKINNSGIGYQQSSNLGHHNLNNSFKMGTRRDGILSGADSLDLPNYSIMDDYSFYTSLNGKKIKFSRPSNLVNEYMFDEKYKDEINSFINGTKSVNALILERSYINYNKINFKLNISDNGILFIKDSYNDFWKAKINSKDSKIYPVYDIYKAILVPKGISSVELEYNPKLIKRIIFLPYILFILILFLILIEKYKFKLIDQKNTVI